MVQLWKTSTVNAFSTTLNGSISAGDTSIILTSVTGLQFPGVLTLDRQDSAGTNTPTIREYISFTGISSLTLTGCTRGVAGSTAQAHTSGSIVEENFSVSHWNDLISSLTNIVVASSGALDTTKVVDLTTAQALTNKTLTAPILTTPTIDTIASTRINPRIGTVADAAIITPTGDTVDEYTVTALAQAATIAAPSGTPVNGQKLILRLLDNGTARALTWNAIYVSRGATLPTTTTLSKYTYVGLIYNSTASKWDCVAVVTES